MTLGFLVFACSNKKLTSNINKEISFEEAYYQAWHSGVRGGGSGIKVSLEINSYEKIKDSINILGLYFRKRFLKLKLSEPNKFQAFIKDKSNSEELNLTLDIDGKEFFPQSKPNNEKVSKTGTDFPYELKNNEAVFSYKYKGKIKNIKITLTKRESQPMM